MNGKAFSDAMSEIGGEYVNEALSYNAKNGRSRRLLRIPAAAAAAVLALLLLGGVVWAIGSGSGFDGTRLTRLFHSDEETGLAEGYDLIVAIEKTPADALTGDVREVGDVIKRQFESFNAYDNRYPGSWQTSFATRDMACDYIGFDRLKRIDLGYSERETVLDVFGNEKGQILTVDLETLFYSIGEMNVQFFSRIYTEHYKGSIENGVRTLENLTFEESFYTTASGKQCQILNSSAMESGYLCQDGYIVDDGVLYVLHIAYKENDSAQATKLMHHWADLF